MQRPTREQLRAIYDKGPDTTIAFIETLLDQFDLLSVQVSDLRVYVKSLEDQIAKDSHNSSKPPSSDGPNKKRTKSLRKPSQRSAGGQKGHEGHTLKRVAIPDKTRVLQAPARCQCGRCLDDTAVESYESRQVFDIPPVQIEVTEYKAEIKICPQCEQPVKATFPKEITQPVQYGPRLKSQVLYLMNQHLLPYERTAEIVDDFYKHRISTGTLYRINEACFDILEKPVDAIKNKIISSAVAHFDETSLRVNRDKQWLHTAGTSDLTLYHIHERRGKEAMDEMGILPIFSGTAVHDHFKSYLKYDCKHALCNSHILRELTFLVEQHEQTWAQEMSTLLLEIKKATEQAKNKGQPKLRKSLIKNFEQRYFEILEQGFKDNPDYDPRRKRKKKTDAQRLLTRMQKFKNQVLAFMYDLNVPFDNNLAERDIRMMKLHQKISGCFRAKRGAEIFCRIRSFVSTARKQGHNRLDALYQALQDDFPKLA